MLLSKQYATPWPMRLGLAVLLVLLVLAWVLYLERAAYYDLAWHVAMYLKSNSLFLQNRRFVAIVTQWPTLMATRAGWSLEAVLRFYSLVFILYYLAIFLLCAFWLKNEHVALAVPLMFVLIASRTFYWAQSEFPQGLVALLLWYAIVARQTPLRWDKHLVLPILLVPVVVFSHPLVIFPIVFLWGYDWLLNRRFRDWPYYALLGLMVGLYLYRSATIGGYESQQMTFKPNLKHLFPYYFNLTSVTEFIELCKGNFIALPLLLLVLVAYYLAQRSCWAALRLAWVWGFVAVYVFVVVVSRPDGTEATYLENIYLPLGIFIAIPITTELLPALERSRAVGSGPLLAAGLLGLVLLIRLGVLWHMRLPYVAYRKWMQQVMTYGRQFPERRFLLNSANIDPLHLRAGWPWWASPYESLLLSSYASPDSAQTVFIAPDADRKLPEGQKPGIFLNAFTDTGSWDIDWDFSPRYFRMPRTTYRALNTPPPADTAALRSYIATRQGARIELLAVPQGLEAGREHTLQVRITVPLVGQPLHSGLQAPHPTLLRTRFLQDKWPNLAEPMELPLEVDVYQPWVQTLPLRCPTEPGKYDIQIELFSKGYRDWPVKLLVPVEVK
jgi:hypothetical protein